MKIETEKLEQELKEAELHHQNMMVAFQLGLLGKTTESKPHKQRKTIR